MTRLTYITKNGNKVTTYAEALADGGVRTRCYEPIAEPSSPLTEKQLKLRVKAITK